MDKLKNIIIINDECGISGGGPKVSMMEANEMCKKYNVVYFCGFITSLTNIDSRVKVVSVYKKAFLKQKNKLIGSLSCLYSIKAKHKLKKLLKSYSKNDTVIHVHGFTTGLSSSIFNAIYSSKIQVFFTCHSYHMACPNGGFFKYPSNKICNYIPMSKNCKKCNCDSRNKYFKKFRILRQKIQNKNIHHGNNNIHYIFISNLSKNVLINYLKPQVEYRFVHNPIDRRDVQISSIKENSHYIFIGRIQREKGIELLCEYAHRKGIFLDIIGDGNLRESLEKKYASNKICFKGWQNYDFINKAMLNARALIFSSVWYECEPLTILEAKSVGLPVLVSKLCAGVENVTKSSGIIYDPFSYDSFSDAIDILNNDEVISIMSKKSYEEFEQYLQKNNHIKNLIDFFEDVL